MTSNTPTYTPPAPVARSHHGHDLAAPRPNGDRPKSASLPARAGGYGWAKVAFDLTFGVVLLVLTTPVILVAAVAIRLTSAGPAFYTQTRLGRGGRPFRIIKLRTMYHNCEKTSGARWSTPGDSRITRLGRFLRVTHLDELPQLVNVLRLEMSLVGPRPERPEITPALEAVIPNYRERLQVRPGVTGLAQLRLPADTCVVGVRRKLAYDLHYIRAVGLWLDLRLMASTVIKMTGIPLTGILNLCRVPGPVAVGLTDEMAGSQETREHEPASDHETREQAPLPPKG